MTWESRPAAGHLSTRRPADATFPEVPDYDAVDLANTFAAIAREMETASSDPEHVCRVITRRAVDAVPGCSYAGITMQRQNGAFSAVAPTDKLAERVHVIQNELGEGPCLSASINQGAYLVNDLRYDDRWPRFAGQVLAELPVASILSSRLFTSGRTTSALDLYAENPHVFTAQSRAVGAVLAAHAAIAMLAAYEHERAENLEVALQTSRQIGIAIGLIMHSHNLTEDAAFDFLVDTSQRLNRKLRDVAAAVVEEGEVPNGT